MTGDSVDDIWAQLQADDSAARAKSKPGTKKKKTDPVKLTQDKPRAEGGDDKQPAAPAPPAPAVEDKEVTAENVAQHMHFHIRSLMGGTLAQRKESLRFVSRVCQDSDMATTIVATCWEDLKEPLIQTLADDNSSCREVAAAALKSLCSTDVFRAADNILALASMLQTRFAHQSSHEKKATQLFGSQASEASDKKGITEDVEEVRVVLVQLVMQVITGADAGLIPALDPLVSITLSACCDPAPDVKYTACTCASLLATKAGENFTESHWNDVMGGVAFKPNAAISHQHARVREAAIVAVGAIMPLAPTKLWTDTITKLKRVHLDRAAKVRLAVLRVLLAWLLAGAATSQTAPMLVQLLMGEADEVQEVSAFAEGAIASVGTQRSPECEGPLEAVEALLGEYLTEVVPEVVEDVVEWRSSTRHKAARTLVVVVKYAAEACEEHLDSFLPALFKGCRDDDDEVAKIVFEAAECIGEVVGPTVFVKRIMQHATSGKYEAIQRVSHLQVLACMLATADPDEVVAALPLAFDGFRHPALAQDADLMVMQQVLDCIASVVENCGELCRPEAQGLLEVLSNVRASCITDDVFCAEVDESTAQLAEVVTGKPSVGALYAMCATPRICQLLGWADVERLCPSDVPWDKDSAEISQLETVILMADAPALVSHLPLLVRAVAACSDRDHEAELRLRMVRMLAALSTEDVIATALSKHYNTLLHSIVMPCCKWFAGRMMERLRESATALLCLMMRKRIGTEDDFEDSEKEVLESIRHNIDDDWVPELRRCATETLGEYIAWRGEVGRLDGKAAQDMMGDLLKRLDDKLDEVRLAAQMALRRLFEYLPEDFSDAEWGKATQTLMIHLDDPSLAIRQGVQSVMEAAAGKRPRDVMVMCEQARGVHQTPVHCEALLHHCRDLLGA